MSEPGQNMNLDYQTEGARVSTIHHAVRREHAEPEAGDEPVRFGWLLIGAALLIAGGGVLGTYSGGFSQDQTYAFAYYSGAGQRPPGANGDDGSAKGPWIDVWMAEGKKVYGNCVACHQAGGSGMAGQFPPLVGSEYVDGGTKRLAAILHKGLMGPITVGGQSYNTPNLMPAWNTLSDEKLAQVATYIRRSFGKLPEGESGVVTTEMMKSAREEFSGLPSPLPTSELAKLDPAAHLPGDQVDLETGDSLGAVPADGEEKKVP